MRWHSGLSWVQLGYNLLQSTELLLYLQALTFTYRALTEYLPSTYHSRTVITLTTYTLPTTLATLVPRPLSL